MSQRHTERETDMQSNIGMEREVRNDSLFAGVRPKSVTHQNL